MAEFFDVGRSRVLPWQRRPEAARLIEALADPDRGFDAIVIGAHERAFYGNQYSLMAPLFTHHGVQLWMPEVGGAVDPSIDTVDELLTLLGILAKREIVRARARSLNSMTVQVLNEGRYQGGRPPYGYLLVNAGPHPNRAKAADGLRLHALGSDPATAQIVVWIFRMRLAGHGIARITRALNDAGIPCPSAADPARNRHRTGGTWKLTTVRAILANPVYTGRQVWGRTRTDHDLIDPANTGLGHRDTARWNTPDQWIISTAPAHAALVTEADFIAVQGMRATREDAKHPYQLAGLLRCALCQRTVEGHWVNHVPGYRCRHGHTSAATPDPGRPKNTYLREDRILAALPLLHHRLNTTTPSRAPAGASASTAAPTPPTPQEVIDHLRTRGLRLSYHPQTRTLEASSQPPVRITI